MAQRAIVTVTNPYRADGGTEVILSINSVLVRNKFTGGVYMIVNGVRKKMEAYRIQNGQPVQISWAE